jgi:hypothetical protein
MKNYLKTKLRNFLENLLELSETDDEIINLKKAGNAQADRIVLQQEKIKKLEEQNKMLHRAMQNRISIESVLLQEIKEIKETIKNTLALAVDVNMNKFEDSWAIVCLKKNGKTIIEHYNLRNSDGHEIHGFLKSFGSGKHFIDSHIGFEPY